MVRIYIILCVATRRHNFRIISETLVTANRNREAVYPASANRFYKVLAIYGVRTKFSEKMPSSQPTNSANGMSQPEELKSPLHVPVAVCGMALRVPGGINHPNECKLSGGRHVASLAAFRALKRHLRITKLVTRALVFYDVADSQT